MTAPLRVLGRGWRVATAVRVFAIALATGQALSAGRLNELGIILIAISVIAAAASAADLGNSLRTARFIPAAEGLLVAVLIGTAGPDASALLPYLIAPPMVAGVRLGWLGTLNATLATTAGLAGASLAVRITDGAWLARASWPWVALGLGSGLLATWQTRSVRALEDAQSPYVEAHRLLSQLRHVSVRLSGGLDSASVAQELATEIAGTRDNQGVGVWTQSKDGCPRLLAEVGFPGDAEERTRVQAMLTGEVLPNAESPYQLIPMLVGETVIGMVVIRTRRQATGTGAEAATAVTRAAVRLHSAILFEDIRDMATTEERSRLAREIHDGVAQDVASLGYLVDELAAATRDPEVQRTAETLRGELTRVVAELRHSIFDLRHGVEGDNLGDALRDYAQRIAERSDLIPHVTSPDEGVELPERVQSELLRITQEAVTNVRKHARAENVWISFDSDIRGYRLVVEDDGVGETKEREGHYGLRTMKERARMVGATLAVCPRPGGGTRVEVATRPTSGTTTRAATRSEDDYSSYR